MLSKKLAELGRVPADTRLGSSVPQAPNRQGTWSARQQPRSAALSGARATQIVLETQPLPLAAIELAKNQPVVEVAARMTACDGGHGSLGHPRIFINLVPAEHADLVLMLRTATTLSPARIAGKSFSKVLLTEPLLLQVALLDH